MKNNLTNGYSYDFDDFNKQCTVKGIDPKIIIDRFNQLSDELKYKFLTSGKMTVEGGIAPDPLYSFTINSKDIFSENYKTEIIKDDLFIVTTPTPKNNNTFYKIYEGVLKGKYRHVKED